MRIKKYSTGLNQRDRKILTFLWLWKVATTSALTNRFYAGQSPITAYHRLWALETCGYIESISDIQNNHHVWTLTRRGFQIARETLPELREDGFRSESASHDLITSAVHLGGFLLGMPQDVGLFTEQQLRRYLLEFYPDWVPRSDVHRPDGYWRVPIGNPWATIGLEVELFQKATDRYGAVADFYRSYPSVARVLWLVSTDSIARQIHDKIKATLPEKMMVHDFISLPNFVKSSWNAIIESGPDCGKPIRKLLGISAQTSPNLNWAEIILDGRKSCYKSRVSAPVDQNSFRNRVG